MSQCILYCVLSAYCLVRFGNPPPPLPPLLLLCCCLCCCCCLGAEVLGFLPPSCLVLELAPSTNILSTRRRGATVQETAFRAGSRSVKTCGVRELSLGTKQIRNEKQIDSLNKGGFVLSQPRQAGGRQSGRWAKGAGAAAAHNQPPCARRCPRAAPLPSIPKQSCQPPALADPPAEDGQTDRHTPHRSNTATSSS